MQQATYAIGLLAMAPLLLVSACPKSEGTAVKATTNDFTVKAVDVDVSNGVVQASGVRFEQRSANSKQMTYGEVVFWNDKDGDGVIDADEEQLTPLKSGGGGPTGSLETGSFKFQTGGKKGTNKDINAYKGHVLDADGNKQEFQGRIGQ